MVYDWTRFDISFYHHAPLETVWRAWTTPRGLESFFVERCQGFNPDGSEGPHDGEFVQGGSYAWAWRHGHPMTGRVLELRTRERFGFEFGSMEVRLSFHAVAGAVRVDLHQSGIQDTEEGRVSGQLNCRSCWIFFMTNLLAVLQHGQDLRDADPQRVSSMEVGFQPPEQA